MCQPVSSKHSRTAARTHVSPGSKPPPGRPHVPCHAVVQEERVLPRRAPRCRRRPGRRARALGSPTHAASRRSTTHWSRRSSAPAPGVGSRYDPPVVDGAGVDPPGAAGATGRTGPACCCPSCPGPGPPSAGGIGGLGPSLPRAPAGGVGRVPIWVASRLVWFASTVPVAWISVPTASGALAHRRRWWRCWSRWCG